MPKFVFQLEGVLRHRKHVERQKQRDLAGIQAESTRLQNELRALNDTVQATNADMRDNRLTGKLDMSFLAAHRRYTIATQRQALTMMQRLVLVQRQVEEAQKALADAAKERKILEKLRDKHRERWMETLSRRELTEQDEISMQLSFYAAQHPQADLSAFNPDAASASSGAIDEFSFNPDIDLDADRERESAA